MSSFPSLLRTTIRYHSSSLSGSITSTTTALLLHTTPTTTQPSLSSIPTRTTHPTGNIVRSIQRNNASFHSPHITTSIRYRSTTTHHYLSSSSSSSSSSHNNQTPTPTTTTTTTTQKHQQLLRKFQTDMQNLETLRPSSPSSDCSLPPSIISAGSSYTRLWRPSTWETHQTPPLKRYFRHVSCWHKSSTATRIFPAVITSFVYSFGMAFVLRHAIGGRFYQHFGSSLAQGASAAMASLTAPLALLLTFRTNASLGRLLEARLFWGRLILHARSLAGLLVSAAYTTDLETVVLACRYLTVLGWSTKALVRDETSDSEEQMVRTVLETKEADWLLDQPKRTVGITIRLRNLLAGLKVTTTSVDETSSSLSSSSDPPPPSPPPHFLAQHQLMESILCDIEADFGGCERLLTSPIPPTYSRHLSRIMVIYLGLLPFGLVASGIPSFGTAVASGVISYMLIGIDEIGLEIENPFPLLPLQQLAAAVQKDVVSQLLCKESMP